MRSDILRIYKTLHTWTGLIAGMALFIAFFAGALTMFKHPLERWVSPPEHSLNTVVESQYDQLIQNVLLEYPETKRSFSLHIERDESISAPLTWSGGGRSRLIDLSERHWQASLDDNNALYAESIPSSKFAELIDMLHRTAGIPGAPGGEYLGITILGIVSILYALALISGLIILLPTLLKDFFALRVGKNLKRFWLDTHNIVGITSFPFHVIICLTAIIFAFHDYFYFGLGNLAYEDKNLFPSSVVAAPEPYQIEDLLSATTLLANIKSQAPDFEVIQMDYSNLESKTPGIRVAGINPDYFVRSGRAGYLRIHPYTGEITDAGLLPGQQDTWNSIVTSFFALHFGSYGGSLIRWVYFLLGLSGAFLFYSGNLLWVESRRKKLRRGQTDVFQKRSCYLMASATVGVCLGSIIAVCFAMIAGKWLYNLIPELNKGYIYVYYTVFLSCVIWVFWRGPGKGSVNLLYLCSFATFLIPLSSLIAFILPASNVWVNTSIASLSVDFTALISGCAFLIAARITQGRVMHGSIDSVWSNQCVIE